MEQNKFPATHETALAEFWKERAMSLAHLQIVQKIVLRDCLIIGDEGHRLLLLMFAEQRAHWEAEQLEKLAALGEQFETEHPRVIHIQTKRPTFLKRIKAFIKKLTL